MPNKKTTMSYGGSCFRSYLNRFISADTIVPDPTNPQSFNRYSYVKNNPVNFTDPTGHRECGGPYDLACSGEPFPEKKRHQRSDSSIDLPSDVDIPDEFIDWYYSPKYGGCFRCHAAKDTSQTILTNEQLALAEYQMERAAAEGSASMLTGATISYVGIKLIPLLCGGDCSDEAVSIWTRISPTRSPYPKTAIPRSFLLSTSNGNYYVAESGTKHMAEYVSTHPNASQTILESFDKAVTVATSSSRGMIYNQPINVQGWELIFVQGTGGPLPVIIHALYFGSGGG